MRLRTLADVAAHLDHVRHTALANAIEIRVRRPRNGRAVGLGVVDFVDDGLEGWVVVALTAADVSCPRAVTPEASRSGLESSWLQIALCRV